MTEEEPGKPGTAVRFGVVPTLKPDRLQAEDPTFKREILDALREKSKERKEEGVPLTPLLREYVEGLGLVHEALRKHGEADAERCGKLLAGVIDRARREISEQTLGLAIVVEDEQGHRSEREYIFGDLRTRWEGLVRRNRLHERLSQRYVNGRGKGD